MCAVWLCPSPHLCCLLRSDSRILQDAGLRVSAVKVSLHQPADPNQGTSVHSPYLTKGPDGKGMMKRKGPVRSATFTAGSADTLDSIPIDADIIGRLGSRGETVPHSLSNAPIEFSYNTCKASCNTYQPPVDYSHHFVPILCYSPLQKSNQHVHVLMF